MTAGHGTIHCPFPATASGVFSTRLRVLSDDADWLRMHLDLEDPQTGERLTLALLSHTPTVLRRLGRETVRVTDMGGRPRLVAGRWYRVTLRADEG